MPSVYDLKPRFQTLLRPLVQSLAAGGVTANQVMVAAAGLSFLFGALVAFNPFEKWPLLLLMTSSTFDPANYPAPLSHEPIEAIFPNIYWVHGSARVYLP